MRIERETTETAKAKEGETRGFLDYRNDEPEILKLHFDGRENYSPIPVKQLDNTIKVLIALRDDRDGKLCKAMPVERHGSGCRCPECGYKDSAMAETT
jgi:hypothetical protein